MACPALREHFGYPLSASPSFSTCGSPSSASPDLYSYSIAAKHQGRDENGLANGTTSISGHQIRYSVLKCICAVLCLLAQSCPTLATPWTVAHQASLSMGIFQEKYTGEGCHALFQGTFPTQGSNPGLLHCRHTLYHLSHQGREMYLVL